MPVRSKKQWKWMAINKPKMLKKWQGEAPVKYKKLPDKVAESIDGFIDELNKLSEQVSAVKMSGQLGKSSKLSPGIADTLTPKIKPTVQKNKEVFYRTSVD